MDKQVTGLEQLFTVEDIANMTSTSDRTIRNYLRNGLLKGRKIGGQWRFTMQDIKTFLDGGEAMKEMKKKQKQEILDFIDGVNSKLTGERQTCVIVDLYISQKDAIGLNEKICDFIAENMFSNMRFDYDYSDEEKRARFTILASPKTAIKILEILK